MKKQTQTTILGDWITDVYINVNNLSQNQEVELATLKGNYNGISVYPGGTGFVLITLLKLLQLNIDSINNIISVYMLPKFISGYHPLYDAVQLANTSVNYLKDNINHTELKIMEMDDPNSTISPTTKTRFISKSSVNFRLDDDNKLFLKKIDYSKVFKVESNCNNLILIDYNKGYFNKPTLDSLLRHIQTNSIKIDKLVLNSKPDNFENFIALINYLYENGTEVIIQQNEAEFVKLKDILYSKYCKWSNLIITYGSHNVQLFTDEPTIQSFAVKKVNAITTSGAGDMLLAGFVYYHIYENFSIDYALSSAIALMPEFILNLNSQLFGG
jgi:hypothetical protein